MTKNSYERLFKGLVWANRAAWAAFLVFITAMALLHRGVPDEAAGQTYEVRMLGTAYLSAFERDVWLAVQAGIILTTISVLPFAFRQAAENRRAAPKP